MAVIQAVESCRREKWEVVGEKEVRLVIVTRSLVFPDEESGCISRETGTRHLEQGSDLIRLIVQEDHANRWGRLSGEGGAAPIIPMQEVMRPDLGQVLQEWGGSVPGETFLKQGQLPLLII